MTLPLLGTACYVRDHVGWASSLRTLLMLLPFSRLNMQAASEEAVASAAQDFLLRIWDFPN